MREVPSEASAVSHQLLVRAGFIRQVTGGIYVLLTMALRVLQKIDLIVREEMANIDAQEISMPILQPRELWEQTGRWARYERDDVMFQTTVGSSQLGLSPTAEEVVTWLAANGIHSHRQLPLTLYQIGPKFRKEMRPRFGLVRGREFEMKDAYSFDIDEAGMNKSFADEMGAYERIFQRIGFNPLLMVQADSGAIGGSGSAEFMAVTDSGEDTLIVCRDCGYGANREKAVCRITTNYIEDLCPMRKEPTPGIRTVEELEKFFGLTAAQMMKTIIYLADNEPIAVCMRGDREINEVKLKNMLGCATLGLADEATILEVSGAPVGFAGPINMKKKVRVFYDQSVVGLHNFLCGCNEFDMHLLDVNFGRDLPVPEKYYDLHNATVGDGCANCEGGLLKETHGIELGHIFKLQKGYSEKMNVSFTGSKGEQVVPWMGCYGIGTSRCVQAIIEQPAWHDDKGMIWPRAIAPYEVVVVPVNYKDPDMQRIAERVYAALTSAKIEVVIDDRDAKFGEKITDADLIGYPTKIIVGRDAKNGLVEVVDRKTGTKDLKMVNYIVDTVRDWRKADGIE